MVDAHWSELGGRELRVREDTWRLTGDVELLNTGDLLALAARQTDDTRGKRGRLYFGVDGTDSLNPGNLGGHFDRLERDGDDHVLVVKTPHRTYRYQFDHVQYG